MSTSYYKKTKEEPQETQELQETQETQEPIMKQKTSRKKKIVEQIMIEKTPEELISLLPKKAIKKLRDEVNIEKKARPPRSEKQIANDKKLVEFQKARMQARLQLEAEEMAKINEVKKVILPSEETLKKATQLEKKKKESDKIESFMKRVEKIIKPVEITKVEKTVEVRDNLKQNSTSVELNPLRAMILRRGGKN